MTNRLIAFFFLVAMMLLGQDGVSHAKERLALVVGNSEYKNVPRLANPVNDARLIAEKLRAIGFEVTLVENADLTRLKAELAAFTHRIESGTSHEVALVYFAGHGMQIDGTNYLMPTDALIGRANEVVLTALSLGDVLRSLQIASAQVNILILDACRDNPFKSTVRGFSRGLASISAPAGSIVAYSTAPGQLALDGDGSNSPYAKALADSFQTRGLSVEEIFKRVRIAVNKETAGKQVPWEETSLTEEVVFLEANMTQNGTENEPATPGKTEKGGSDSLLDSKRAYLKAVGENTVVAYDEFIQKYPQAAETKQALENIEILNDEKNWREAVAVNTAGSYAMYLKLHPSGTYTAEARRAYSIKQQASTTASSEVGTSEQNEEAVRPSSTNFGMLEIQGFDVSGKDIETLRGVEFSHCSEACARKNNCAAAAYRPDLRRCYLKSSAVLKIRNARVNAAIRANLDSSIRVSDFEMLPQSDIPGGDLFPVAKKAKTANICLRLCEKTLGCKAFAFVTTSNSCWLKAEIGNVVSNPPVVSGRRLFQ